MGETSPNGKGRGFQAIQKEREDGGRSGQRGEDVTLSNYLFHIMEKRAWSVQAPSSATVHYREASPSVRASGFALRVPCTHGIFCTVFCLDDRILLFVRVRSLEAGDGTRIRSIIWLRYIRLIDQDFI